MIREKKTVYTFSCNVKGCYNETTLEAANDSVASVKLFKRGWEINHRDMFVLNRHRCASCVEKGKRAW